MITPFKQRKLDLNKKVRVHRNLNAKNYSIKQDGIVVAHATHLALVDCTFHVSACGQKRVRESGHKNVHAFIEGRISQKGTMGINPERDIPLAVKVSYNPYKDNWFMATLASNTYEIAYAQGIIINNKGVTAAYTEKRK